MEAVMVLWLWLVGCSGGEKDSTAGPADTSGGETADTSAGDTDPGDTTPVDTSRSDTDESGESGESGETEDTSPEVDPNLYPLAPDADHPAWQGLQERFVRGDGSACSGSVAVGVGQHAVCYAASDGALRCAGALYGLGESAAFTDTAVRDATQVFVSRGTSSSSACALVDGRLTCIGDQNGYGQFGSGGTAPSAGWIAGQATNLQRLATGSWDQICAVDAASEVWCAGYSFGATPSDEGAAGWIWVDTGGILHKDDSRTWRVSPSKAMATLGSSGLDSDSVVARYAGIDGTTGLVDVVVKQRFPDGVNSTYTEEICWLDAAGGVRCTHLDPNTSLGVSVDLFVGKHVVLLAAAYEATTLCAVVDDGSMWCLGDNDHGQLGVGDTTDRTVETQVVPAGGVRIDCR